jgi:hypothetical protein
MLVLLVWNFSAICSYLLLIAPPQKFILGTICYAGCKSMLLARSLVSVHRERLVLAMPIYGMLLWASASGEVT